MISADAGIERFAQTVEYKQIDRQSMFNAPQKSAYCIDWTNARLINFCLFFILPIYIAFIVRSPSHTKTFKEPNSSSSNSIKSVHWMNCAIQLEKQYVNDFVLKIEKTFVTAQRNFLCVLIVTGGKMRRANNSIRKINKIKYRNWEWAHLHIYCAI